MRYFNEIQKLPGWIYIVIGSSFVTVLILILNQYTNTSSPSEKEELLIVLVAIFILEALSILLISNTKQEVTIDANEIRYRYLPLKIKEVQIPISKIKNYDCINYNNVKYGYRAGRFNFFVKTPYITMIGISKAIKLTFTDNSNLIIGTKKPEEFIRVLNHYKNRYHEVN
ncbi:hypothetical protein GTQ40_01920 [Flavobacteriaceae bacterium R38]|nr:hypothetical protein [Flavobacteriaceae bacterium R38]